MKIEYYLYEKRISKNYSLRKLSDLSGISKSQIELIESGRTDPRLSTMCYLAAALELDVRELFDYRTDI